MNNNTIDREEVGDLENLTKIRKGALLMEIIPFLFCIGSIVFFKIEFFFATLILWLAVYIFGSWYIFKTDKYRAKDIIFTELSIILFL